MVHKILVLPALIAMMLMARPASAEDIAIDGVPLPGDAHVADAAPPEFQPWSGVWVGAWGGTLKHILLVEAVKADGSAQVVYAIGDNPWFGIRRAWSRHHATLSGRRLTIAETGFSATYDLDDQGGLKAKYTRGPAVSHAVMTRSDLATLTASDAVVPWTRGKSQLLRTDLIEDGKPVNLEVVIFKPQGTGPFPLAVINHGSTGRGTDPALFKQTFIDAGLAGFLNDRGWIVAFPQRRGRGKSDGLYDEGFAVDRQDGYTCDFDVSLSGAERALNDIAAVIGALRQDPDVSPAPILIGGVSRGGILSVAYAGMHPDQISVVVNFVGGWIGTGCDTAGRLNGALFERGAHFGRPTLWLYGENDPFYDIPHSRTNFDLFRNAGGRGTFLTFAVPGGSGHFVLGARGLWEGSVEAYLSSLTDNAEKK